MPAATSGALLEVRDVAKSYGGAALAVDDMNFTLRQGETAAVLGPSGCGKSTLLRLIAGLETPDRGDVLLEGRSLAGIPPHVREFGLMFQDLALFPHLDVYENVAFGLRMRRWPEPAIRQRVEELLAFMRIPDFARRKVNTLSGGEQQRVALARSLAPRPRLLMLDEPLGALDRTLREELVGEIGRVLRETRVTALYVTHDQDEAFAVAERVLIMQQGRLVQEGAPAEVYLQPASAFVARFLGHRNLIPCRAFQESGGVLVDTPLGRWALPGRDGLDMVVASRMTLLIPPDALSPSEGGPGTITATVRETSFREGRYRVRLTADADGRELLMETPASVTQRRPSPGETLAISLDTRLVRLLPWGIE
jgi:ABC-type Fe3+/spermidine/putrescine transport system ATPase subunit